MGAAVDHTIVVCEGPGHLTILTLERRGVLDRREVAIEGLWPCWSPDGGLIAASTLQAGGREVRGTIELLDGEGRALRTAHQALPGAPPVIAPRVPHYVYWAPGGATLAFVAPGPESLGLYLSDRHGAYSSDRIAAGAPIFFSWSPDARRIAIHAGADLSIYDVAGRTATPLASNAIGFRAPVFARDRLIYASPSPPGVVLVSVDAADPGRRTELGTFEGGVVLQTVAGDPPWVSVSLTREPDTGTFHELFLVDPATGARSAVAKGPYAAAIWSPRGDRAAVVVPGQMGDGRYSLVVYDRAYLLSHALWSADGSAILCCGRLPGDAVSWSFADRQNDYVWYWPVERGSAFVRAAVGDSAFFRPGVQGNGR
jgi:Tol biopolymer transport system component